MLTIFTQTLMESMHRRMAVLLLLLGLAIVISTLSLISFETAEDGTVMATPLRGTARPALTVGAGLVHGLLVFAQNLWMLLALFAAAPLLTTYMDKGWAEMIISKGVPRWQIVMGRYLGGVALIAIALFLLVGVPGLYFWLRAGYPVLKLFGALTLVLLSYGTLLGLMALVATQLSSPVIPIMVAFLELATSGILANRQMLYPILPYKWMEPLFEWSYNIFPKHVELSQLTTIFLRNGEIDSWWPVWSTGMFLLAAISMSCWLFHRKSF